MDSKDVTCTHMCTCTHSIILFSHKKEWNFAIHSHVDELGGIILGKIRKTNTVWYHLCVESQNYSKLVNITRKQTHRSGEETNGYSWEGEGRRRDGIWVED